MGVTWKKWKEMREYYFELPEDPDCVILKDMEKCEIEGCNNWCSTLTQCKLHAQLEIVRDDDGE